MYKKQIGQQKINLLSVYFSSCLFYFVSVVCNIKKYHIRAWHCYCLHNFQ